MSEKMSEEMGILNKYFNDIGKTDSKRMAGILLAANAIVGVLDGTTLQEAWDAMSMAASFIEGHRIMLKKPEDTKNGYPYTEDF